MRIHFTDSDIAILQNLLAKLEKGYCSKCHLEDDDSGIIFVAEMESEQIKETRLSKLIIHALMAIKQDHVKNSESIVKKKAK